MLYYKQALQTQHLFDWQLYNSAVRLILKLPGASWCAHTCTLSSSSKSSGSHLIMIRTTTLYSCTVLIDSSHRSLVCRKTTCCFINTDAKQTKLALKMEMVQSFETSVTVYEATRFGISEYLNLQKHCGNLR